MEMEFVRASAVTSGWRGVVTSLCLSWQLLTGPLSLSQGAADHSEGKPIQRLAGLFDLREAFTHCREKVFGHFLFLFLRIRFEMNDRSEVKVDFLFDSIQICNK